MLEFGEMDVVPLAICDCDFDRAAFSIGDNIAEIDCGRRDVDAAMHSLDGNPDIKEFLRRPLRVGGDNAGLAALSKPSCIQTG